MGSEEDDENGGFAQEEDALVAALLLSVFFFPCNCPTLQFILQSLCHTPAACGTEKRILLLCAARRRRAAVVPHAGGVWHRECVSLFLNFDPHLIVLYPDSNL